MRLLLDTHTLFWSVDDPFDRLIIAQALVDGISVVSVDVAFDLYGVTRIW